MPILYIFAGVNGAGKSTLTQSQFNKVIPYEINADEITIDFDDSIIEDKGAEQVRAQTEVGNETRSRKSYMRNIRNMTDKQIEEELQEIQEEKMSNQEAFGFNGNIDEE